MSIDLEQEIKSLERRIKNKRNNAALSSDEVYRTAMEAEAVELVTQLQALQTRLRSPALAPKTGAMKAYGGRTVPKTRIFKGVQIRYKS